MDCRCGVPPGKLGAHRRSAHGRNRMHTIIRRTLITLAVSLLTSGPAAAATQTILGKQLRITDGGAKRTVSVVALEHGTSATIVGDATADGATLDVIANGGSDSRQTFTLPSSGWTRQSLGFKWSNRSQPGNPVKRVTIKRTPR